MLPVEAQITAFAPRPAASLMAAVMPRSLNEPVGLHPSSLSHTSAPVSREIAGAWTSGVFPSPNVSRFFSSTAGSETRVTVNTSTNGGTTAIAAATATLSTSVTAVNDAPLADDALRVAICGSSAPLPSARGSRPQTVVITVIAIGRRCSAAAARRSSGAGAEPIEGELGRVVARPEATRAPEVGNP